MKNLSEALKEIHPKLTIYKLSKICNLTLTSLYKINDNPETDVNLSTIMKIHHATLEHYGKGLKPWEYLMHADFRKSEKRWTD